jgi:DNA mismatch repair protein MutL
MGKIRVLPESVINTIAAGEVVERPASVAKELIENALDAGATSVRVHLEDGGRRTVEVRDDGWGMDGDDAVAALERHATSKLTPQTPLESVGTLGFRGEALPSIAAVSRLTLVSGTGDSGTRVEVEGGNIRSTTPASHPRGTTVTVRDLFFNTPARRRFLRTAATETGHIVELFTSLALSRPEIRFRLDHGGKRVFDLPSAGDSLSRLGQMEGADAAREAVVLNLESEGVKVSGFLLHGRGSGQSRGRRILVNGRVVRDRLLLRAISRAVEENLPAGTPSSCLLSLEIPLERVDVNVHPAKAEVRFRQPGVIFRMVQQAVGSALEGVRAFRSGPIPAGAREVPTMGEPGCTETGFRDAIAGAAAAYIVKSRGGPGSSLWERAAPEGEATEPSTPVGEPVVVGHYRSGYILAEDEAGLLIVDQHAAHERILFEILSDMEGRQKESLQPLLFPRTIQPPAALRGDLEGAAEDLNSLGFQCESFGDGTLLVRGVPAALSEVDPESLVLEVLASAREGGRSDGIEARRRRMLSTAACHAAVKVPSHLTSEKIGYILARLLECRAPLQCPHGRPTILRWSHRELERRFGRP